MRLKEKKKEKTKPGDVAEQSQETNKSSPGHKSPAETCLHAFRGNRAGLSPAGKPNSHWGARGALLVTTDANLEQVLIKI